MPLSAFPRIFISCPCVEARDTVAKAKKRQSQIESAESQRIEEEEEEGKTFNPRSARATFSLFPLDHLLYCDDCGQIRCPRCVNEEIVCYFCPSCLFEVPTATVKTEGNRCNRNCFQCPECFATLSVTAVDPFPKTDEKTGLPVGPFTLLCNYCPWSSAKHGIEFEKPTSISTQLSKMKTAASDINNNFTQARTYYTQKGKQQQDELSNASSSLGRMLAMYSSSLGGLSGSKSKGSFGKSKNEENSEFSGIMEVNESEELEIINRMRNANFEDTATLEQRYEQPHKPRFKDDLLPTAALLRTKRSKRCRACRHILVKPDSKVNSVRFRIKLAAINYIPQLNLSRLTPTFEYANLQPLQNHQYLLTVTNPLFDPISVTLATPNRTPGKYGSTVTILCPQFDVGANTDVWDEALQDAASAPGAKSAAVKKGKDGTGTAGSIWDSGRNWTAVVVEVVPPSLDKDYWTTHESLGYQEGEEEEDDEAVVQIPVFVRVVYETELVREDGTAGDKKEKNEHAYWYVLSVGRIGKSKPQPVPAALS